MNILVQNLGQLLSDLSESTANHSLLSNQICLAKSRLAEFLKEHPEEIQTTQSGLEEWMDSNVARRFINEWVLGLPYVSEND